LYSSYKNESMLSRVADSIYSPVGVEQQWEPLVMTTGDLPRFKERYGKATSDNVIQFLTFDQQYPNSIISCLQAARENARSVRETISSEMWERVNAFYLMVKETAQAPPLSQLPSFFAEVKLASHLFSGVMDATMTHNEGWHFGHVGRLLERADKTARILDVKYFILLPSARDVSQVSASN
jgi:uncharacterized alpha-E superfamily protein